MDDAKFCLLYGMNQKQYKEQKYKQFMDSVKSLSDSGNVGIGMIELLYNRYKEDMLEAGLDDK